jgi:hypothetical protein
MPDHAAAILVPLVLPLAIWLFLWIIRLAARANLGIARHFVSAYEDAPSLTRAAAFLLVLAGAIHLALVPGHLTAPLAWLVATLAAYLFFLGAGLEVADLVGIATYVVELIVLGVIWIAPEATPAREVPDELTSAGASIAHSGYRVEPTPGGRP